MVQRAAGLVLAVSIAAIVGAEGAVAAAVTFSDEVTFEGAAGELSLESFEELVADNSFRARSEVVLSDLTVSTPLFELSVWSQTANGAHATDGSQHLQNSGPGSQSDALPRPMDFEFDAPVAAFGLMITDWGDFGAGTLSYADDAGNEFTVATTPRDNANELFFGIVSDEPFTVVTLSHDIQGEGYGVDEVRFAPEPTVTSGSLAALAGLAALATRRRRPARSRPGAPSSRS